MNIGEAIKQLRKSKGLQQKEFAVLCDISQTYLSQIENNRKTPNLSILESISAKIGVPIPVIMFLGISEDDVSGSKKELFNMMNPTIQRIIKDIFLNDSK